MENKDSLSQLHFIFDILFLLETCFSKTWLAKPLRVFFFSLKF